MEPFISTHSKSVSGGFILEVNGKFCIRILLQFCQDALATQSKSGTEVGNFTHLYVYVCELNHWPEVAFTPTYAIVCELSHQNCPKFVPYMVYKQESESHTMKCILHYYHEVVVLYHKLWKIVFLIPHSSSIPALPLPLFKGSNKEIFPISELYEQA